MERYRLIGPIKGSEACFHHVPVFPFQRRRTGTLVPVGKIRGPSRAEVVEGRTLAGRAVSPRHNIKAEEDRKYGC